MMLYLYLHLLYIVPAVFIILLLFMCYYTSDSTRKEMINSAQEAVRARHDYEAMVNIKVTGEWKNGFFHPHTNYTKET